MVQGMTVVGTRRKVFGEQWRKQKTVEDLNEEHKKVSNPVPPIASHCTFLAHYSCIPRAFNCIASDLQYIQYIKPQKPIQWMECELQCG